MKASRDAASDFAVVRRVAVDGEGLAGVRRICVTSFGLVVEFENEIESAIEQLLPERRRSSAVNRVGILAEEFEILAVVKDEKAIFVLTRPKQIATQSRAAANHLPEL